MPETSLPRHVFLILGALLVPATAWASDMPPLELLLIPPVACMTVFSVLGWFASRLLHDPTARHFTRLLLLALMWTPVPGVGLLANGIGFVPSGLYFWMFFWSRGDRSPYIEAAASRDQLTVAIAVGIVCVLGSIVVLARSYARLRQSRL